jgi:hypothetical protein
MTDNHRGVIGEITHGLANAEKQARWRERSLKNENGTKFQFIFDASTRARLKRIACHKGCSVTSLINEWAASAERRVTHQLSGKALKRYYGEELLPPLALAQLPAITWCAQLPVTITTGALR